MHKKRVEKYIVNTLWRSVATIWKGMSTNDLTKPSTRGYLEQIYPNKQQYIQC